MNFRDGKIRDLEQKVVGLNTIISQLKEEVKNKDIWGNELLEKYEKSIGEIGIYKKTIDIQKDENDNLSRIWMKYKNEMKMMKAKNEKRVMELEESIKILTKTTDK